MGLLCGNKLRKLPSFIPLMITKFGRQANKETTKQEHSPKIIWMDGWMDGWMLCE